MGDKPLRLLAVSDEVSSALFGPELRRLVDEVDVLLACGDLPYSYLEYLSTVLSVRHAFFVHGNHDVDEYLAGGHVLKAPGGWVNADRRSFFTGRLLIGGLEGCIRYKPRAPYQYTEAEMRRHVAQLTWRLLWNRMRYGRFLDILITHSPPAGIHDGPDGPHRGFAAFLTLMQRFKPRLLLHGHKHHYGHDTWRTRYLDTEVVNVHPFRIIEWHQEGTITYGHYRR